MDIPSWICHSRDGTKWMVLRYVYGLFWERVGDVVVLMNALKTLGLSLDLLGLPVTLHLARLRSMCAHYANFWSFVIWGCSLWRSSVSRVRSSSYAVVLQITFEVLKW